MTLLAGLMLFAAMSCAGALAMAIVNLRLYRRPPTRLPSDAPRPLVSVCVPARNEQDNLEACARSILAGTYDRVELLVYDDQSTDQTPRILSRLAADDPRVRAVPVQPLPPGWAGKQHACWRMGQAASGEWLLFTDADVRFDPLAVERTLAIALSGDAALLSTFPRQITASLGERLLVPMIFFLLLSYLPLWRMRTTTDPATSAACGQFLFVRRDAYHAIGGHEAFRASYHDGIMLPRALRRAGYRTDLFDGQDLASVRMYRGFAQTWRGFAKNAFEGLGSLGLLVFLTFVHTVAHAGPFIVLALAAAGRVGSGPALWLAGAAAFAALAERALLAARFRQGVVPVLLHPVGALTMTAVQWHSWWLSVTGRRAWRGRVLGG
jgi:glycosyltransferase involved in cell wall biosynthesis